MALYEQSKWPTSLHKKKRLPRRAKKIKEKAEELGFVTSTHNCNVETFLKTDETTSKSVVVKSTKAVQNIQPNAVKNRPKTTKVLNAPFQTPKTTMTDNCFRSVLKRIRSPPDDAEGFNTLKVFCKGDQRDLADIGQQNDYTVYGQTSLIL